MSNIDYNITVKLINGNLQLTNLFLKTKTLLDWACLACKTGQIANDTAIVHVPYFIVVSENILMICSLYNRTILKSKSTLIRQEHNHKHV